MEGRGKLPSSCRKRWKLNTNDMTLWALLQSSKCDHVLCVGHSLGGALASIAATKLGERRERAIAADAFTGAPSAKERRGR